MNEIKRIESRIERERVEDELNRQRLKDKMEDTLEKKLRDYVLHVVFQAELKPIKQFIAGFVTALVSVAGGLLLWLITR